MAKREKNTGNNKIQFTNQQAAVADFFASTMALRYSQQQIENAQKIWADFVAKRNPRVLRPNAYAAAIEYVIVRLDLVSDSTKEDIAKRYQTSCSSISRIFNEMRNYLEFEPMNPQHIFAKSSVHSLLASGLGTSLLDAIEGMISDTPGTDSDLPPFRLNDEEQKQLASLSQVSEEWSGARRYLRQYVIQPQPFRPQLVLWAQEQKHCIVGHTLLKPDEKDEVVLYSLVQAMLAPLVGSPRRPSTIVIDDQCLAIRLTPALREVGIRIRNDATPFIDALIDEMENSLPDATPIQPSYLEGGRIPSHDIAALFRAAAQLIKTAPWSIANDNQILGVEINQWGVEQACVSIIGAAGIDRGLLIFKSLADYLTFNMVAEAAESLNQPPGRPAVEILSLTFQRGSEMNLHQRKEVLQNGWVVSDPNSFPLLLKIDADNILVPLTREDYRIAQVCADAVSLMVSQHPKLFRQDYPAPNVIREKMILSDELNQNTHAIIITAPHSGLY